jgi:hypothetical protein
LGAGYVIKNNNNEKKKSDQIIEGNGKKVNEKKCLKMSEKEFSFNGHTAKSKMSAATNRTVELDDNGDEENEPQNDTEMTEPSTTNVDKGVDDDDVSNADSLSSSAAFAEYIDGMNRSGYDVCSTTITVSSLNDS